MTRWQPSAIDTQSMYTISHSREIETVPVMLLTTSLCIHYFSLTNLLILGNGGCEACGISVRCWEANLRPSDGG